VRVAIQHEGRELWSSAIAADVYSAQVPTSVSAVQVRRGEHIYFRVQSVMNGAYDRVAWDPTITYLGVDSSRTDVNGLTEYRYRASQDFLLAGRRSTVTAPLSGRLHMAGSFEKTGSTSDDVALLVTKNGSPVSGYPRTLGFADAAAVAISDDIDVSPLDELEWRILADSAIDATRVKLALSAYYTSAEGVDRVTDDDGNYILVLKPANDMDLYPAATLSAPQSSWTATQTGTLAVVPALEVRSSANLPAEVVFTAKRRNALLGKSRIAISRDADGNVLVSPGNISIAVNAGDEIFFDFSTKDVNIAGQVLSSSVQVTYDMSYPRQYFDVPHAFHSAANEDLFPVSYRGWGAAGYNGNSPRGE
jgi:hypothetical protein